MQRILLLLSEQTLRCWNPPIRLTVTGRSTEPVRPRVRGRVFAGDGERRQRDRLQHDDLPGDDRRKDQQSLTGMPMAPLLILVTSPFCSACLCRQTTGYARATLSTVLSRHEGLQKACV